MIRRIVYYTIYKIKEKTNLRSYKVEQVTENTYRKFVGKTSVIRQSSEALPQEMTELKMALTIRLFVLLYTKYMAAEQQPAEKVANTENKIVYKYNKFL